MTVGAAATDAATKATKTIPIVGVEMGNPVQQGFVASLARPGGNVTGLATVPGPEIIGKNLQLLMEAVPNVSPRGSPVEPVQPGTPDSNASGEGRCADAGFAASNPGGAWA